MSTRTHDGIKKRYDCGLRKHDREAAHGRGTAPTPDFEIRLRGVKVCGSAPLMA